jgi:maltooligosyltrehalose trehalohydrolase
MHTFEVWAPKAKSVAVQTGGKSWPLEKSEHGWWSANVESARPGDEYAFEVDGADPVPDPRSPYQPHGVHGPSCLIDHSQFSWTDHAWQAPPMGSAIIYELHVGTFTPAGTFRGAMERLDYLADLGITHVELMPLNEFSGTWGWGYDGVDLYAPHHSYGTPDDLKALIDACHAKGLAVLADVVYNHFGPAGNYLGRFGPYLTDAYHTPWGAAVNLDHEGSCEVRKFFIDNALMWLRDYHFDGLRLDAIHAYFDSSAIHFLEDLSAQVDRLSSQLAKHFVLIAESDLNDPRVVRSREAGGFGIDAQWSDDFHHALHTVLTGEKNGYYSDFGSLADLAKALQHAFIYDGIRSPHRDRVHGRPIIGLSGHHFLAYAQNHDQIGNRANGERLIHLTGPARAEIAAALVLLSPFVPMLFQGEEFGASAPFQYFTQHDDEELAKSVSEGRRSEFSGFGWSPEEVPDPQEEATFHRSKLNWDELKEEPHRRMLEWHKKLIRLRRSRQCLSDGRMEAVQVQFDERARWITVTRGSVQMAINLGSDRQAVPVRKSAEVLLANADTNPRPGLIELPADGVAILG